MYNLFNVILVYIRIDKLLLYYIRLGTHVIPPLQAAFPKVRMLDVSSHLSTSKERRVPFRDIANLLGTLYSLKLAEVSVMLLEVLS